MSEDVLNVVNRHIEFPADAPMPQLEPLTGGVSSDIWKIETTSGPICVKRALSQLKTRQAWFAPTDRNAFEAEWIRTVANIVPAAVPELVFEDRDAGLFGMMYMTPETHPVWKELLRDGTISADTAGKIGAIVGTIHAATADDPEIAGRFATDETFHALRIEPYLLRTAAAHPDIAARLKQLAATTAATRRVLVHGDVSPKNILVGPLSPVLLDAECAWFGDPAFDLAFCLNHLLLKCIWKPTGTDAYLAAFDALAEAYLQHVDWEPAAQMEARTAALLPALLLARIDGASPVEYITQTDDKDRVRRAARPGLQQPSATLQDVCRLFRKDVDL